MVIQVTFGMGGVSSISGKSKAIWWPRKGGHRFKPPHLTNLPRQSGSGRGEIYLHVNKHDVNDAFSAWYIVVNVIMGMIASQITSLTIVCSTVYSGANQRKHQISASLAFVRGIHRGPVNSPHKWPVTRKVFPFDDVIMDWSVLVQIMASHRPLSDPMSMQFIDRETRPIKLCSHRGYVISARLWLVPNWFWAEGVLLWYQAWCIVPWYITITTIAGI